MAYIKNNNGKIEIISCTKEEATKQGLKKEPNNFVLSKYGKLDINFYNEDYTTKTDDQLLSEGLIFDNTGTYYDIDTKQKIIIDVPGLDKPDNLTDLKPFDTPCKWEVDKWVDDIEGISIVEAFEENAKDILKADKLIQSAILVIADLVNKTPEEMRQLIIDKYNTI